MSNQQFQSALAEQLANLTQKHNFKNGNKNMKYRQHQQNHNFQKQGETYPPVKIDLTDHLPKESENLNMENNDTEVQENMNAQTAQIQTDPIPNEQVQSRIENHRHLDESDYENKIPVESLDEDEEEEDETADAEPNHADSEDDCGKNDVEKSPIVPFASQIDQEVTFVIYPEEIGTDSLLPGFVHRNPFSRKGGTLRLLLDNLIPTLTALEEQKILMLGDAKQATSALMPMYTQITEAAFETLLSFSAKESSEDVDFDTVGLPIDDRIFIKDGNVNLTFFSPYPDLQEDIGVKQIDNLAIWLSKLSIKNLKLNLIFAYTVEDLLDSSVNLVLNTLAQNESLDASVYLAKSNNFDLHPDLVKELTSSFDAFVCLTVSNKN